MKGDLDGAVEDYEQAIRFKPDADLSFNNRGIARFEKGDLNGALEDYERAIRLNPDLAIKPSTTEAMPAKLKVTWKALFRITNRPSALNPTTLHRITAVP